jgi:integrase
MLNQADNTLRPFLAIGAFAGLRKNELQQLDWNEVNLERGFITVAAHKAKTRQRRLVPISENLKLWLQPLAQKQGPVCLHENPQAVAAYWGEKLGIKWEKMDCAIPSFLIGLRRSTTRRGWLWKRAIRRK